ncbi:stalk domain-containing protein [Paenibacillus taiwanensis]|uniref:NHL domain-containing protein n=1 Tax=Paenibacillus taiwanensis TaxID=401638 RepID=UPI000686D671|nr:stalk domain-containing protein [Paenibacillus taiwanensis]
MKWALNYCTYRLTQQSKRMLLVGCVCTMLAAFMLQPLSVSALAPSVDYASIPNESALLQMNSPAVHLEGWLEGPQWYELVHKSGSGESGWLDGEGALARFRYPTSLVVDSAGKLIVADTDNHLIRAIDVSGTANTIAGAQLGLDEHGNPMGGWLDGKSKQTLFQSPMGMAIGKDGTLYIADSGNHVIRKRTIEGTVSTIAGDGLAGWQDGAGKQARFHSPRGIAIGDDGTLYVADSLNHVIRTIDHAGNVKTITARSNRTVEYSDGALTAAGDYKDGTIADALFNEPSALIWLNSDTLVVSDTGNQRIRTLHLKLNNVSTLAGSGVYDKSTQRLYGTHELYVPGGYRDGAAKQSLFSSPTGLAIAGDGSIVVADRWNHVLRMIKDDKVYTVAGQPEQSGAIDGFAGKATLHEPTGVAVLKDGRIVVADSFNNKIRVLQRYELPVGVKINDQGHSTDETIALVYNKQLVPQDVTPQLKHGSVWLPLRALADAVGIKASMSKEGTVILTYGSIQYELTVGSQNAIRVAYGQRTTVKMHAAPYIEQDRVMLPIRFVAEQFGLQADWLPAMRVVVVRDPLLVRYEETGSSLPPQ